MLVFGNLGKLSEGITIIQVLLQEGRNWKEVGFR